MDRTERFSPEAPRWVRREVWQLDQPLTDEADGCLTTELPFTVERELTMEA